MGKAKSKEVKESLYEAKALVHIKYDKENYKPGDEFDIRESDVEELKSNGYAEVSETPILEETTTPPANPGEDEGGQEPGGNGGQ